jgi:NADH:ubiquinone oxidoreductase subunit 4 (subunit M)
MTTSRALTDINAREFLMLSLAGRAVLYMGIYPKPFTDVMDARCLDLLKHVACVQAALSSRAQTVSPELKN